MHEGMRHCWHVLDKMLRLLLDLQVQINLSWKVSDTLILHAKDAPLDEKYGDFERFEYGPALSSYLASMQAPEVRAPGPCSTELSPASLLCYPVLKKEKDWHSRRRVKESHNRPRQRLTVDGGWFALQSGGRSALRVGWRLASN